MPFIPPRVWAGGAPCPAVTPGGHFQAQGSSSAVSLGEFMGQGRDAGTHTLQPGTRPCPGDSPMGKVPRLAAGLGGTAGPSSPLGTHGLEVPHEPPALLLLAVQPRPEHPKIRPRQQQAQHSVCHCHLSAPEGSQAPQGCGAGPAQLLPWPGTGLIACAPHRAGRKVTGRETRPGGI